MKEEPSKSMKNPSTILNASLHCKQQMHLERTKKIKKVFIHLFEFFVELCLSCATCLLILHFISVLHEKIFISVKYAPNFEVDEVECDTKLMEVAFYVNSRLSLVLISC